MLRFLHNLSAVFFYLLAGSFFVGYLLMRNSIGGIWPAFWMQVGELPLALSAVLYAGTSLYQSVQSQNGRSWILAAAIALPLALFFLALVAMNFWVA